MTDRLAAVCPIDLTTYASSSVTRSLASAGGASGEQAAGGTARVVCQRMLPGLR
jgi:hypothetical protein